MYNQIDPVENNTLSDREFGGTYFNHPDPLVRELARRLEKSAVDYEVLETSFEQLPTPDWKVDAAAHRLPTMCEELAEGVDYALMHLKLLEAKIPAEEARPLKSLDIVTKYLNFVEFELEAGVPYAKAISEFVDEFGA